MSCKFSLSIFGIGIIFQDKVNAVFNKMRTKILLSKIKEIGDNVHLHQPIWISNPSKLILKNNIYIGPNAKIASDGGVTIEDNCSIGDGLSIYSYNHNYKSKKALPFDEKRIFKPVHIHANVWIGLNVAIVPGVTIGEGAIVGMGSVVTKDVPPLALVGGNPAKIIKYRNKNVYEKLRKEKKIFNFGDRV